MWFQRSENPAILIGGLGFAVLAFILVAIYLRFRNIEK
jgi:high-affinity Fe2+/Pb2+ permease